MDILYFLVPHVLSYSISLSIIVNVQFVHGFLVTTRLFPSLVGVVNLKASACACACLVNNACDTAS